MTGGHVEGDKSRWVEVSTALLAELGEWSEPVRVKVVSENDGRLEMIFQRDSWDLLSAARAVVIGSQVPHILSGREPTVDRDDLERLRAAVARADA